MYNVVETIINNIDRLIMSFNHNNRVVPALLKLNHQCCNNLCYFSCVSGQRFFLYPEDIFPLPSGYFTFTLRIFHLYHPDISPLPSGYFIFTIRIFHLYHPDISPLPSGYFISATLIFYLCHPNISLLPSDSIPALRSFSCLAMLTK